MTLASLMDEMSKNLNTHPSEMEHLDPQMKSPEMKFPGSCARGRTMKEFEEELSELRRENFDLKVKIYLMEEQQELIHAAKNAGDVYKINLQLSEELAEVKKELTEKDDLVLQAAKAMDLLMKKHSEDLERIEEKSKKDLENSNTLIAQLENEIKDLKSCLHERRARSKFDDVPSMYAIAYGLKPNKRLDDESVLNFESQIKELEKELNEETSRRLKVESTVSELEAKLAALQQTHNETQEELASHMNRLSLAQAEIHSKSKVITQLQEQLCQLKSNVDNRSTKSESDDKSSRSLNGRDRYKVMSKLEAAQKENTRLKGEIEALRKRNIGSRDSNTDTVSTIELLQKEKSDLLKQLKDVKDKGMGHNAVKIFELERTIQSLKQEVAQKEVKIIQLERETYTAMTALKGFIKQNKELVKKKSLGGESRDKGPSSSEDSHNKASGISDGLLDALDLRHSTEDENEVNSSSTPVTPKRYNFTSNQSILQAS